MSNDLSNKKNSQYNIMIARPIEKLLISLSIPTIASMLVTTLYNIVDAAFVGMLGTSQSGATGIVGGFMAILQAIAFMCGQGCGSLLSRRLGQKKNDEATMYASTGFCMSFSLGLITAVCSFIFMPQLLNILGSTVTIAPYARTYLTYILIAAPLFTSSLTLNNILRYEGKAKFGTIALMTGGILNILGDALLMCVFKLGIAGAGISTAVTQTISFAIIVSIFFRGKTETKLSIKYVATEFKVFIEIAATGFPSMVRQGLNSVATMILNKNAGIYGDQAVAAMSIVGRLSFFPMAVAIGIGQGFQPISGFNYGAGRRDRVKEAYYKALVGAELALIIVSIPLFIFAPWAVARLRDDVDVIEIGVRALRLICVAQLFVPLSMMTEMGFQIVGRKMLATISSSLRSGIVFIPTLIILARFRGLSGIQEAQPVSFIITFVICLFFSRIYLNGLNDKSMQ